MKPWSFQSTSSKQDLENTCMGPGVTGKDVSSSKSLGRWSWHTTVTLLMTHTCLCKNHFSRVTSLQSPWTVACQSPRYGFSRHEYWSGVAISLLRGSCPTQRSKPTSLTSPVFTGRFFTTSTYLGSPLMTHSMYPSCFKELSLLNSADYQEFSNKKKQQVTS